MGSTESEENKLREALLGPKSDEQLTVGELKDVGRIIFGAEDRFRLYGLDPEGLEKAGCDIVGRTAMECKVDAQCAPVAAATRDAVLGIKGCADTSIVVCDPFAGSGNMLYHVAKELKADPAFGFELTPSVADCTLSNIKKMSLEVDVTARSFMDSAAVVPPTAGAIVVVIVDPPWGGGFEFGRGLVLDKTDPTVPAVLARATAVFAEASQVIFVIATPDDVDEESVQRVLQNQDLLVRGAGTELPAGVNGGYIICTPSKDEDKAADLLREKLLGPMRESSVPIDLVKEAGRHFFGSVDAFRLYGQDPASLEKLGVTLVGRTVVEAQIDAQCYPVADGMKEFLKSQALLGTDVVVYDPFAGSCNLLFHVAKAVGAKSAIGFENDPAVVKSTREIVKAVGFDDCDLTEGSILDIQDAISVPENSTIVVLVAPPWAAGFQFGKGLILDKTSPPVPDVLDHLQLLFKKASRVVYAVLTYEFLDQSSVDRLAATGYKVLLEGTGSELPKGSNTGYLIVEPSN